MRKISNRIQLGICCVSMGASAFADDPKQPQKETQRRFDLVVREDIFAGFGGDSAALKALFFCTGVKRCES